MGALLSAQSLGTVLTALPVSLLAGRVRYRTLLLFAAILGTASYGLLVTQESRLLLRVAAGGVGAAFIVHHVVAAPFFMRNSTPTERLYLFGFHWAVEILAGVIAGAVGGWLAHQLGEILNSETLGYRYTLLGAAGLLGLSVIPYLFLSSPRAEAKDAPDLRRWRIRRPGLLLRLMLPAGLVGLGAGLIIPFLNLYFEDRFRLGAGAIGRVFAVSQALTVVGYLLGPALARRVGMIRTVVACELLSIPFFLMLAFTARLEIAIFAFWMRGALMNMNHPISSNFAMEVVEPDQHAFTNALLSLSWSLSWMFSTRAGGWLIEGHGFTLPMLVTVTLYFISSLFYLVFFHDYERRVLAGKATVPVEPTA